MRMSRRLSPTIHIGCFIALWSLVCVVPASAQRQRLSDDLLQNAGPLQQSVTNNIETYVEFWSDQLNTAESVKQVVEAREQLLEPIKRQSPVQATEVIRDAIARAAAAMLEPAIESDKNYVRLNALIVLAQMPTGASAPVYVAGLQDDNRSIRYWAAKGIAEMSAYAESGQSLFTQQQQTALLDELKKVMTAETSDMVLEQMYRALASMTIPEAQSALLDVLSERVKLHVKQVNPGLRADTKGLSNLYSRLLTQQAVGNNVDKPLRRLTAVAGQLIHVVAKAYQTGEVPQALQPVVLELTQVVQDVFTNVLTQFDPDHNPGPALVAPLKSGQGDVFLLNALDWADPEKPGILVSSKIGIPADQLRLPE